MENAMEFLVEFSCRLSAQISNSRMARSLRTRPRKRVTMIMVGLFTTEASIRMRQFRRGAHSNGGHKCFWQRSLTGKQLLHGEKGGRTGKTHPESTSGWVLIGWVLGPTLSHSLPPSLSLSLSIPPSLSLSISLALSIWRYLSAIWILKCTYRVLPLDWNLFTYEGFSYFLLFSVFSQDLWFLSLTTETFLRVTPLIPQVSTLSRVSEGNCKGNTWKLQFSGVLQCFYHKCFLLTLSLFYGKPISSGIRAKEEGEAEKREEK